MDRKEKERQMKVVNVFKIIIKTLSEYNYDTMFWQEHVPFLLLFFFFCLDKLLFHNDNNNNSNNNNTKDDVGY